MCHSVGVFEILHDLTVDGVDVFEAWLDGLRDATAAARVVVRVDRMQSGNFGDHKPVGGGVWELRIDHGPGYRVYSALSAVAKALGLRLTVEPV